MLPGHGHLYREAVVQATIDCTGMAICIVDLKGHDGALWRRFFLGLAASVEDEHIVGAS